MKGVKGEQCILVDQHDQVIGADSKNNCHRDGGLLHRAFSVCLFNTEGKLLVQKRSDHKVTFPGMWANSCCSHPLYCEEELEAEGNAGIKRAAIRRLQQELGVDQESLSLSDIHVMTRLHYQANSSRHWSEQEIDYLLVIQKDLKIQPNQDEVSAVQWLDKDQLRHLIRDQQQIAPWFLEIEGQFLYRWWEHLENLDPLKDSMIHRSQSLL